MNFGNRTFFSAHVTIGLVSTILFTMMIVCQSTDAWAQHTSFANVGGKENNSNSTLAVTGSAVTKIKPDKVSLSLGVETTGKTANESLATNSLLVNNIISALRSQGLQENETSTSVFNIFPNYNFTEIGTRLNITGFTVINSIQIESSSTDKVSSWIDTAVNAGANNINSIDFTTSHEKIDDTRNVLIEEAISNARRTADIAAAAVELKVVGVKSIIVEGFGNLPSPQPLMAREPLALMTVGPSTPVLPGEQQVSSNVDIVFLIG